jgi:hypothetical protein
MKPCARRFLFLVAAGVLFVIGFLRYWNVRPVGSTAMGVAPDGGGAFLSRKEQDKRSGQRAEPPPQPGDEGSELTVWLGTHCAPLSEAEEDAWLLAEGRRVPALLAVALSNGEERRRELLKEVLEKDPENLTALLYGSFDPAFGRSSDELMTKAGEFHGNNAWVALVGIKRAITEGDFKNALDRVVGAQGLPAWETGFSGINGKVRDMYVDSGRVEAAAELRNFLEMDDQILMNGLVNTSRVIAMPEFAAAPTRDKAAVLAVLDRMVETCNHSVSAYMFSLSASKAIIDSGSADGDDFGNYLNRSGMEFASSIQSDIDGAGQIMALTLDPASAINRWPMEQRLEFSRKLRNIGALEAAMSLNRR